MNFSFHTYYFLLKIAKFRSSYVNWELNWEKTPNFLRRMINVIADARKQSSIRTDSMFIKYHYSPLNASTIWKHLRLNNLRERAHQFTERFDLHVKTKYRRTLFCSLDSKNVGVVHSEKTFVRSLCCVDGNCYVSICMLSSVAVELKPIRTHVHIDKFLLYHNIRMG